MDRRAIALAYVVGLDWADAMAPLWGPSGEPSSEYYEKLAGYGRCVSRWARRARLRLELTRAEVNAAAGVLSQYPWSELEDLRAWAGELLVELGVALHEAVGDERSVAYPSSLWEQNYWKRMRM